MGSIPTFGIMKIEDIMMRNEQLVLENEALRQQIEDLKNGFEGSCMTCEIVGEMNKQLRAERDEARWEVCGFHHLTGFLAGDYAISRGWNYFNDERKWAKFPPSVTDFDKFLKAHSEQDLKTIERLREENRKLRELRIQGVVSEPQKATPPHYENLED